MKKNIIIVIATILIVSLSSFIQRKPKILIVGDSISLGYTPFVQKQMANIAEIVHNEGNAQHTGTGLQNIAKWVGSGDWDVIQFNWGLWDLCYRRQVEDGRDTRDTINGIVTYNLKDYANNLDSIVKLIKKNSNAKLVFVTTSYVPGHEPGRKVADAIKYNEVAKKVMKKNGVMVNDIYEKTKLIHDKWALAPDNVHYVAEGYKEIALSISDYLGKVIKHSKQ